MQQWPYILLSLDAMFSSSKILTIQIVYCAVNFEAYSLKLEFLCSVYSPVIFLFNHTIYSPCCYFLTVQISEAKDLLTSWLHLISELSLQRDKLAEHTTRYSETEWKKELEKAQVFKVSKDYLINGKPKHLVFLL